VEVIKNINGVYVGSARGGAQESFSRGYDMSANNMFKMVFVLIADLFLRPRKVEVQGSALYFTEMAPGGILNMVLKLRLSKKEAKFQCKW
jgi:iron complex outermembrane receptor protein